MPIGKSVFAGVSSALGLLIMYFAIQSWAYSPSHAVEQLAMYGYLLFPLVAGFGLQVGLYTQICTQQTGINGLRTEIAATGGISTGSMMTCCVHRLVEFVPMMGLAALAGFVERYQISLLLIGIVANLLGIFYLIDTMRKYNLYRSEGQFRWVFEQDWRNIRGLATILSAILIVFSFFLISLKPTYSEDLYDYVEEITDRVEVQLSQ